MIIIEDFKSDLIMFELLRELKASDDVISLIDKKILELNKKLGSVNIIKDILGEERVSQLINDNDCRIEWNYTYIDNRRVELPQINIKFNLVDGVGDSVICLTLLYHTDTKKWEHEQYSRKKKTFYDSYDEMIEKEFDGNYEYEYDYGNIYL